MIFLTGACGSNAAESEDGGARRSVVTGRGTDTLDGVDGRFGIGYGLKEESSALLGFATEEEVEAPAAARRCAIIARETGSLDACLGADCTGSGRPAPVTSTIDSSAK